MQVVGDRFWGLVAVRSLRRCWRPRRLRRPRWLCLSSRHRRRSLNSLVSARHRNWRRQLAYLERVTYSWISRPRRHSRPPGRQRSPSAPQEASGSGEADEDSFLHRISISPYLNPFTMLGHSLQRCEPRSQ